MVENVTLNAGAPWTVRGVEKLRELWAEGVAAEMVAQTLSRPESEVRAKAAELGLPQHVNGRGRSGLIGR